MLAQCLADVGTESYTMGQHQLGLYISSTPRGHAILSSSINSFHENGQHQIFHQYGCAGHETLRIQSVTCSVLWQPHRYYRNLFTRRENINWNNICTTTKLFWSPIPQCCIHLIKPHDMLIHVSVKEGDTLVVLFSLITNTFFINNLCECSIYFCKFFWSTSNIMYIKVNNGR